MSKKTATKPAATDLPKTPIEIGGKTYFMCFDMDSLAAAEEYFNQQQGANVNLLKALASLSLKSVRQVWPCAIHTYHPEIGFKDAQKLLSVAATYELAAAIVGIWAPVPGDQAPVTL